MKVHEFIKHLHSIRPGHDEDDVVIELTDGNIFPSKPQVGIRSLNLGYDWDNHKVFLKPDRPINVIKERTKDTMMEMIKGEIRYTCPVCLRVVASCDWYCRRCGQRIVK